MKAAAVFEAVVDRVDDDDKEKKKRRSRNRRAKQSSPVSGASDSPVNELNSQVSGCSENGTTANHVTTPMKQHGLEMSPLTTPSKILTTWSRSTTAPPSSGFLRCAHFAIYDGHGGPLAADYAQKHLHRDVLSAGLPL